MLLVQTEPELTLPKSMGKQTITVEVTQEDINQGFRHNGRVCPVMGAARRALGGTGRAGVNYIWMDDNRYFNLPQLAIDKIADYDMTGFMSPFSFELDIPNV